MLRLRFSPTCQTFHEKTACTESQRNRHPHPARRQRTGPAHRRHLFAGRPPQPAPLQGGRSLPGRRGQRARSKRTWTSTASSRWPRKKASTPSIPGYGFLSENPALAARLRAGRHHLRRPERRAAGTARRQDRRARGWRRRPASRSCPARKSRSIRARTDAPRSRSEIGFPLIVKAAFGGGGRGMRVVNKPADFARKLEEARAEAGAAFGNAAVFLERFIRRAKHIEVQILGDQHGNILHLYERDCSVQRRHQKVVEVAPAYRLARQSSRANWPTPRCSWRARPATTTPARSSSWSTPTRGEWFFIEVNPRIQVEHTVTEMVTGIDLVRSADPGRAGARACTARRSNLPRAGRDSAARLRAAVPRHHRRSGEQLRARLRQDSHLPLARGLRHPARRRHRLTAAR